jgi:hypothetical protein
MRVGAKGELYVASTYAHCVSVGGRAIVDKLMCGDGMATNWVLR